MTEAHPASDNGVNLTDRVLGVLQTRFPHHFEIAVLTAQNELLAKRINELDWEIDLDDNEDEVTS